LICLYNFIILSDEVKNYRQYQYCQGLLPQVGPGEQIVYQ